MKDFEIVYHLSYGLSVKEIAALGGMKVKAVEHRILIMKGLYFALSASHLVAIFIRKKLIE